MYAVSSSCPRRRATRAEATAVEIEEARITRSRGSAGDVWGASRRELKSRKVRNASGPTAEAADRGVAIGSGPVESVFANERMFSVRKGSRAEIWISCSSEEPCLRARRRRTEVSA